MTTVQRDVRVADVMQKEICWAEPQESMQKAARRMHDRRLRCLLVRGAPGELPGIVTSKDVVNLAIAQGKPALDGVLVADVMTRPAICVPAQASMNDGAQLMRIAGVRRLPVLQGTEVVGLLSSSDVFQWLMRT
jgi:CBS domain-containing protein